MERKGPYREQGTVKKTIEDLRKEVARENKIGFQLPENIKEGNTLEIFNDLEQYGFKKGENEKKYEDIILYSFDLGILRFKNPIFSKYQNYLHWQNDDQTKSVIISIDERKKEATVISIDSQT